MIRRCYVVILMRKEHDVTDLEMYMRMLEHATYVGNGLAVSTKASPDGSTCVRVSADCSSYYAVHRFDRDGVLIGVGGGE